MKQKDIKLLWGKSGNRCARCRTELTLEGAEETLGEMAHIVASSSDGPRGESELALSERDNYNNLILLCPNHHTEIDRDPGNWTVDRLHQLKSEHEDWVSTLLGTDGFRINDIDNTEFIAQQEKHWFDKSNSYIAVVISFTPLTVVDDIINDPLATNVRSTLELAKFSHANAVASVNRFHTRPSENGIVNERSIDEPNGHSIELYRSGHCHYYQKIGAWVDRMSEEVFKRDQEAPANSIIRYTDLADITCNGVSWLKLVWDELLPFKYITLTAEIINTNDSTLYSYEDDFNDVLFGSAVHADKIKYSLILDKNFNAEEVMFKILNRFSNSYGLVLHSLYNTHNREFARPTTIN